LLKKHLQKELKKMCLADPAHSILMKRVRPHVNGLTLFGLSVLVTASFAVEMAAGFGSMLVALSVGRCSFQ
jgi:hypothetical protein